MQLEPHNYHAMGREVAADDSRYWRSLAVLRMHVWALHELLALPAGRVDDAQQAERIAYVRGYIEGWWRSTEEGMTQWTSR